MRRDEVPPDVLALIDQFVNEAISEDDLRRLEEALRGNVDLEVFFLRYCQLHVNLDVEARLQAGIDAVAKHGRHSAAWPEAERAPLGLFVGHRRRIAFCAAAVLLVLGVSAFWRAVLRPGQHAQTVPQTQPAPSATGGQAITAVRLDTTETRTIALGDADTMLVQGPAYVELLGTLRVRLHRGRIRVRIASEARRGFVVETPRANVTDLGTEFGIDVAADSVTGVVVFEGSVDVAVPTGGDALHPLVEHLVQGDGVVVRRTGRLDRLMTIVTGSASTFGQPGESGGDGSTPLIVDVWDNVTVTESKKLYEIVPGGFREDALCYVDRPAHEWNGIDARGLPAYLIGADYVKTFNNYKRLKGVKIRVMLSKPARLFVFLDHRVSPPQWLREGFRQTGDVIGMDEGPFTYNFRGLRVAQLERGVGPGQSIEGRFFVWERTVERAGVVTLGENSGSSRETGMYGIAAVALDKKSP